MIKDKDFDKLNNKLNNLSMKSKILLLLFSVLILGALFYITTVDKIETVDYTRYGELLCSEIYVNGELNTSPCPQNLIYFPEEIEWQISNINYSNLI